jgi:hypothetical protein
MVEMWSALAPLIIASALLPLQNIVTLVLVRSSLRTTVAWVAGMTTVRLVQGILFGLVLTNDAAKSEADSPGFIAGLQVVFAVVLYVMAIRKGLADEDEDAPPPKWIGKAKTISPVAAFAAGAGFMSISVKFWMFTLGAISAISHAHLGTARGIVAFLVFVVLAQCGPLTILALGSASSSRSTEVLEAIEAWLQRKSRIIGVMLGVVFGTWFLLKALAGLGII